MHHSVNLLYGDKLAASDGEIGQVKDLYVDDQCWAVRYLVVDTGSWLSGRLVLLPPHALGSLDRSGTHLQVRLTRRQIEESPAIATQKPVSRQFEQLYYQHYGLPFYWFGGGMWGMGPFPILDTLPDQVAGEAISAHPSEAPGDPHLRSTLAVDGYQIQASDGPIGQVSDFMLDDQSWSIRQLVVTTGSWFSGKKVVIPTSFVERVSFTESRFFLNMTQASVAESPLLGTAAPGAA